MEMMGVFAGIKLKKVYGHVKVYHKLKANYNQKILLPKSVNSFHDFALEKCPDKYHIIAFSEDNVIKAIQHKVLPWEGWMWHPEREKKYNNIDKKRLIRLINTND